MEQKEDTVPIYPGDVKVYPYKTLVGRAFLTLDSELVRPLEEALAEAAGTRPDNHVVYEFRGVLIGFTDHKVEFSFELGWSTDPKTRNLIEKSRKTT